MKVYRLLVNGSWILNNEVEGASPLNIYPKQLYLVIATLNDNEITFKLHRECNASADNDNDEFFWLNVKKIVKYMLVEGEQNEQ